MPGMGGLTLSLQVKATSLYTPVVLILDKILKNIKIRIKIGRIDCVMLKILRSGEIQETMQYFFIVYGSVLLYSIKYVKKKGRQHWK